MGRFLLTFIFLWLLVTSEGQWPRSNGEEEIQAEGRFSRQLPSDISEDYIPQTLLNRGVYEIDKRFNAFVDGLMVNMVSEVRRKGLDPLYFRVNDDGSIEHVPTPGSRPLQGIGRFKRQAAATTTALGGGVITGLSRMKRSRDAEVQMAGNITLTSWNILCSTSPELLIRTMSPANLNFLNASRHAVKSHWLLGPLVIVVDYRGESSITRVKTELDAVQFDALTSVDRFGAEKADFRLNSPLFGFMAYYGNRTLNQQKMTELVVKHLLSEGSFVDKYLEESFEVASYDKIIPQFGADDSYYSVIQYLFNGQTGRNSRLPIIKQLLQTVKNSQISQDKLQKRSGQVEPDIVTEEKSVPLKQEDSLNEDPTAAVPPDENNLQEEKIGQIREFS